MKKRIGVLSDTHLHKVTKDLMTIYERYFSDVDIILHAGDFVSRDVVEFFQSRKEFHGVCGNMDPIEVKRMLPEKKVVDFEPFKLGLIHGWGPAEGLEERIRSEFQKVDIIVYGHSHRAANHTAKGVLLFNPGTVIGYSIPPLHSIGLLEINDSIEGKIIPLSD